MKYLLFAIIMLGFFSCTDDEEMEPEVIISVPELTYNLDDGETFTTSEPTMTYDSMQASTFVKYDDSTIRVRINFRGTTPGVYTDGDGIFYIYKYDAAGGQSIEVICDTFTGIEVTVDEYGEIGEMIEGSFTADNCDGVAGVEVVSGSFSVVRTE